MGCIRISMRDLARATSTGITGAGSVPQIGCVYGSLLILYSIHKTATDRRQKRLHSSTPTAMKPAPLTTPGSIKQTFETRRYGRGGGGDIAICGLLTAHFNFKNRC